MSFYHKLCLCLAIILLFASISYASLNQSHDDFGKQTIKIAKGHFQQGKYEEAIESLKELLEIGNSEAQCLLGVIYLSSENDSVKAADWLEKAALQGHSDAQYFLGSLSVQEGVKQDIKKAMYWLEKAAEQNNPAAQFLIGLIYYKGSEIQQKNYEKALDWFVKSATQNNVSAQYQLGVMYFSGLGTPQNYLKAEEFFKKAALQGDLEAQFDLGLMLMNGEGVKMDYTQAAGWIKKSAEQGKVEAQSFLGRIYLNGWGVKADSHASLYWLSKAADQGDEKAIQILKEWFSPMQELYSVSFPVDEWENWKIDNDQKRPSEYVLEFVPLSETVNNWSQLVTILFVSNEILNTNSKTALTVVQSFKKSMNKIYGDQFKSNTFWATENDVLCENFMPNPSEYEIARLIKTSKGIYRLSYTTRGSYRDEKTKEKWLKSIREARLIKL